jgi:hypothetical protein
MDDMIVVCSMMFNCSSSECGERWFRRAETRKELENGRKDGQADRHICTVHAKWRRVKEKTSVSAPVKTAADPKPKCMPCMTSVTRRE